MQKHIIFFCIFAGLDIYSSNLCFFNLKIDFV